MANTEVLAKKSLTVSNIYGAKLHKPQPQTKLMLIDVTWQGYGATFRMIFKTKTIQVKQITPGIVELLFCATDSPNTLNVRTLKSLEKSLNIIKHFDNLQGLIIRSDKEHFITSANLYEYPYLFSYPTIELRAWMDYVKHIFLELENFPVPTVCALRGASIAEGCELALTCDFRIGDTTTQIGLPQIKFGLIPGLGGSVLLPRIIGMKHAIPLIINGTIINADTAKEIKLLDKVTQPDELLDASVLQLQLAIENKSLWQQRRQAKQQRAIHDPDNAKLIVREQQRLWKNLNRHYVAPFSAISLLADSWRIKREQALAQETNHYITLAKSVTCKNLINNYLNEQQIKQRLTKEVIEPFNRVAVVGSGVVTADLALQMASRNIRTLLRTPQPKLLSSLLEIIHSRLNRAAESKQLTSAARAMILNNIDSSPDHHRMDSVDIVLETLADSFAIKQTTLANIEQKLAPATILATNASGMPITELGEKLTHPQYFCAMNFFPPVNHIPLVEIIPGIQTSNQTIARLCAFAAQAGFTPIIVTDTPGFFINRITASYMSALLLLIEQKVDIERIDRVMEKLGWRSGPATQADLLGLDVVCMILSHLHKTAPKRFVKSENSLFRQLVDNQCHGRKTGCGLYRYESTGKHKSPLLEEYYAGDFNQQISNQEIEQRLMFALCNETIRCLDERVIQHHQDADTALIQALGFPRYLGGALQYIDNLGPEVYLAQLNEYDELGELYQPPAGLRQVISNKQHFYHQPDVDKEYIFN